MNNSTPAAMRVDGRRTSVTSALMVDKVIVLLALPPYLILVIFGGNNEEN